eukprot:3177557-Pyramimonas_sp.AAC.1
MLSFVTVINFAIWSCSRLDLRGALKGSYRITKLRLVHNYGLTEGKSVRLVRLPRSGRDLALFIVRMQRAYTSAALGSRVEAPIHREGGGAALPREKQ